jgi:hypothetical protein
LSITSIVRLADNTIRISGAGETNFTYTMRAASNVADPNGWQGIGRFTTDGLGIFQYDDAGATNIPIRFYRVEFP